MDRDESQLIFHSLNSKKSIKSRSSNRRLITRAQKINDKNMIYPESTENKIVFLSNTQGNGFRSTSFHLSNPPSHINIQSMINRMNRICFEQWRDSMIAIESQPFGCYEWLQNLLGFCSLVMIAIFIAFIVIGQVQKTRTLAYIFIGVGIFVVILVMVGCICSIFLIGERRVDVNRDLQMVKAIKRELIKLNEQQREQFGQNSRFLWTCHKDCLWIACQLI